MVNKENVLENERYGYIGINGVYYVYDHKHSNIPAGYGYKEFKTKKECLEEAVKLNKS